MLVELAQVLGWMINEGVCEHPVWHRKSVCNSLLGVISGSATLIQYRPSRLCIASRSSCPRFPLSNSEQTPVRQSIMLPRNRGDGNASGTSKRYGFNVIRGIRSI